jgi:AAA15 family ATPase/GTPase
MRIKTIHLEHFKRFDNLTIDLGEDPKKIIALVGPNGCGKSSIFDAFEEIQKQYKSANRNASPGYFSKLFYSILEEMKLKEYNKHEAIKITNNTGASIFNKKSFYIRSPYRFTPQLNVSNMQSLPNLLDDANRPSTSSDIDSRLKENYERLLALAWNEYQNGTKSGPEMKDALLGRINNILTNVIDVKISNLGDVISGKGQLYFEKGKSKDFPYENLSSGEKEVVDIVIDLIVKIPEFNDTIYCIDEPELHLNTAIQRKLLIEIEKLVPDTCQLWVATHSIGFLRALQQDLKDKCSVLDFSEKDYFNSEQTIKPIQTTRKNWQRIFQTALEDLTGLLAPRKIFYCEGRPEPDKNNEEKGLDADIYNEIFSEEYNDVLFVSSGGGNVVTKNASLALKVLNKTFGGVELYLLKDKDRINDVQRQEFLDKDKINRMLVRSEIENYLFDKEVLEKFCLQEKKIFNKSRYDSSVTDINNQDLKQVQQDIQACCGTSGDTSTFKRDLAKVIVKGMKIYEELHDVIF